MTSTTFVDQSTPIVAAWLNDVNTVVYSIFGDGTNYTGNLTVPASKSIIARDGTAAAPSITFNGDTDTGFYRIGANNLGAAVNGAKVLDLSTTGLAITGTLTADGIVGEAVDNNMSSGRLTLASGTPVTTTDQTAKTTVYYTPYTGNRIALYYSSSWRLVQYTEKSVAVPSNTSTPFDVFGYYNGTALVLEATAWTNATTRATALTTQDGVLVKSGATDRRYLGTGCTTSVSGQTEDSDQYRLIYNHYNQVRRTLKKLDTTASWTWATASFQPMNSSNTNRVGVMIGYVGPVIDLTMMSWATQSGAGSMYNGIDEDGNSTNDADSGGFSEITGRAQLISRLTKAPALGYHYYQAVERGATGGTWYGSYGGNATQGAGIVGSVFI